MDTRWRRPVRTLRNEAEGLIDRPRRVRIDSVENRMTSELRCDFSRVNGQALDARPQALHGDRTPAVRRLGPRAALSRHPRTPGLASNLQYAAGPTRRHVWYPQAVIISRLFNTACSFSAASLDSVVRITRPP